MFNRIEQVQSSAWETWLREQDGVLIDVRNPAEWASGTLPNAEKISLSELPANLERLNKSQPVLVVCHSGSRSKRAARILTGQGFSKVANLKGGMKAIGDVR